MCELIRVICQIDACCSAELNMRNPLSLVLVSQCKTRDSLERKGRKGPVLVSAGGDYDHGRLVVQSQGFPMTVVSSDA